MNDDEVLSAVRNTLSDVHMDRPVEVIEERGRARRRNRTLAGAVAGGGLAVAAALAVVLPMAYHQSKTTTTTTEPLVGSSATGNAPTMTQAAFTLVKQANGSVKLTLNPKKLLDPAALEKALAGAGIPAVVKAGVLCKPKGTGLPEAEEVFGIDKTAVTSDGSPEYRLVINAAKMPENSEVYFSVFAIKKGDSYNKFSRYLVTKGAPMACRTRG
ncbi:hypothetical protein GCM10010172_44260 [Paractinoplanes ferrugineus]|uniref:Uncharacterized protein n=1 Tax=Paractinoplanes ferrugineus TaxID=113564 RepID=A0A919J6M7_9ACTN|nr:hypothetical protein [Actinoplanes ferrugineus]GIE13584.1 hypothetical protein Afe05nite_54240 [Actinoplanes ferrugineus]